MNNLIEQADGSGKYKYHKLLKKIKIRTERRRAKRNPKCVPLYGKYKGYET